MRRKTRIFPGFLWLAAAVLFCLLAGQSRESRLPAPTITGVRDFYVAVGNSVDYKKRVTAVDEDDGNLTEQMVVDASKVLLDQPGEYPLIYRVENSHGRKAEAECLVYVETAENLQELINLHSISPRDKYIVGAINAYDSGCYRETKVETVLAMAEPAFVRIDAPGVGYGSGFIMEITEEEIYILTNYHVIQNMTEPVIHFHDGNEAVGETIAKETVKDMALIRIERDTLSEEMVDGLKAVHIEKEYWEKLENADILLGIRCIGEDGEFWKEATGKLIGTRESVWEFPHPLVEYTIPNFSGASGSAVLDTQGNLIAMVLGVSYEEGRERYWGVRLPDLLEFYQEATGRKGYYR